MAGPALPASEVRNPIMFVTQVPQIQGDFLARPATFGNHTGGIEQVFRGGDLWIRYTDGALRNLTQEAGFGSSGVQGANSIAVREPSIHWSGTKALFSMLVGSPTPARQSDNFVWQIYEVTNFDKGQTAVISKIDKQPAGYNNVSPIYTTDERILFTSDRPRSGLRELYPNLDEYESNQSVSGIWSLNPASGAADGELHILNHTPSGAFSPSVDSFGRVVFIRWDHLQRDQQQENGLVGIAFNYAGESATAAKTVSDAEVFPEPLPFKSLTTPTPYGPVKGFRFNIFTPWMMNQDGTEEETLNHVGRHEGAGTGFLEQSFTNDPALSDNADVSLPANKKAFLSDGGFFHLREDPARPGEYLAIPAKEFGSLTTNQIVRLTGGPSVKADKMVLTDVTVGGLDGSAGSPGGRFRNPLPLVSGGLIATYTKAARPDPSLMNDFKLYLLGKNTITGLYEGGTKGLPLTPPGGIVKSVSWFNPHNQSLNPSFSGPLWEMEAVEVVARAKPIKAPEPLEKPEADVFTQQQVDVTAFKTWLADRNLALIVSRDLTTRDVADTQQPFNLQVPGGTAKTVSKDRPGRVYDISHLQIFQADQIRSYGNGNRGRRSIAQTLHEPGVPNPAAGGPPGSVKIGADGSMAAFVPARRALTWQTVDTAGVPIVRERLWLTMQPGEVRVCASCHGVNAKDQAGRPAPVNQPEALRQLLAAWKSLPGAAQAIAKAAAVKAAPAARAQPAKKP